jgi:hypothetical protein
MPLMATWFLETDDIQQIMNHMRESSPLCQAGIGEAMNGCMKTGLVGPTSASRGLKPANQLNKVLRRNIKELYCRSGCSAKRRYDVQGFQLNHLSNRGFSLAWWLALSESSIKEAFLEQVGEIKYNLDYIA